MADLADRLARGEPAAFAELYDTCADRLHHFLVMHLGSQADADDIVQETFARLARSRRKLRGVENLTGYVFMVARHEAARLKKNQGRTRRMLEVYPPPAEYDDEAAAMEATETVRAALQRLSPENRDRTRGNSCAELSRETAAGRREAGRRVGILPRDVAAVEPLCPSSGIGRSTRGDCMPEHFA